MDMEGDVELLFGLDHPFGDEPAGGRAPGGRIEQHIVGADVAGSPNVRRPLAAGTSAIPATLR